MQRATRYAAAAIAALSSLAIAQSARAGSLTYATEVLYYNNNGTSMAAGRDDTSKALGVEENTYSSSDFLSLGIGGTAIFGFGTEFSGSVKIWETTWGYKSNQNQYDERVQVFFGNSANPDGEWDEIGTILNIEDNAYRGGFELLADSDKVYNFVKLVDVTPDARSGRDGFDVEAIAVRAVESSSEDVPEPATGLALLGLAAFGAGSSLLKRR